MSMEYVRKTYGVPAKRGKRVMVRAFDGWCPGTITSAGYDYHVIVRPDPWPNARLRCHPLDDDKIRYYESEET